MKDLIKSPIMLLVAFIIIGVAIICSSEEWQKKENNSSFINACSPI